MKSVYAAYVLAIVIALAAMWAIHQYVDDPRNWYYLVPLVVLIPPINMQAKRRMITLRFHDDHLTLETGFLCAHATHSRYGEDSGCNRATEFRPADHGDRRSAI